MRTRRAILRGMLAWALLPIAPLCAAPQAESAGVNALWEEARQAYDAGRWTDASDWYEQILQQGFFAQELFFNLGNAWFKQNRPGLAVLAYRRASYLEPRDPDTLANIQFALQSAKALAPAATWLDRVSRACSLSEWITLQLISAWCVAGLLGVYIFRPRRRPFLGRAAILAAVPLALSLAGIAHWRGLHSQPEVVVIEPNQEALYAPMEGATTRFAAPEGTIARRMDRSEGWIKISDGKQEGWVRASACRVVFPWRDT